MQSGLLSVPKQKVWTVHYGGTSAKIYIIGK